MNFRLADLSRDRAALHRLWLELGWINKGQEDVMDLLLADSTALVADLNGEPECLVLTSPATLRYLDDELPFGIVAAVTTSRLARKRGLAGRLCAQAVADLAIAGAPLVGLGMFEQGYYNQLGFGTGGYEHFVSFDPAQLDVDVPARVPRRITPDDWPAVHAARLARPLGHGGVRVLPAAATREPLMRAENGFGLGFYDGPNGELTHHFWAKADNLQHGPFRIFWMVFQDRAQLLELLALIRGLGDQVHLVSLRELPTLQMQDLICQPFKQRRITEKSPFETGVRAAAYWQVRICDLAGCLERTHLRGETVRFNLALADPIGRFLDESVTWRGVAGDYVVTLGPSSAAERGTDPALQTLTASVGAFSRLWLGVRPATSLAWTDTLAGPADLLQRLDWALRLPEPRPDWDF